MIHIELSKALFEIEDLKGRLATAEAERDAARAEVAQVIERYCDPEEDQTLAEVADRLYLHGVEGWGRAGELQEALLTAQSGEARAVEALAVITSAALVRNYWFDTCSRTLAENWEEKADQAIDRMDAAMKLVSQIHDQPALAWLAQREKSAAEKATDGEALAKAEAEKASEGMLNAIHMEARAFLALREVARLMKASKWKADCDHRRAPCEGVGCNGAQFAQIEALVAEFDSIDTPAWLAQQRAEAAAEALEALEQRWCCGDEYGLHYDEIWRCARDCAAALRAGATGETA